MKPARVSPPRRFAFTRCRAAASSSSSLMPLSGRATTSSPWVSCRMRRVAGSSTSIAISSTRSRSVTDASRSARRSFSSQAGSASSILACAKKMVRRPMADDFGAAPAVGRKIETLNAEVHRICMVEGGYPNAWPRHTSCPCCGVGELRSLFKKHEFNHDQCIHCGFVCVNPYPPDDIVKRLYSSTYYTNFREYYEAGYLQRTGKHSITAAPVELLEDMIVRAAAGRAAGDWLDVGGGMGSVA